MSTVFPFYYRTESGAFWYAFTMTIAEWLLQNTYKLQQAGIESARLDALILLEDELHTNRARLLAYDDENLGSEQISNLAKRIERRAAHEPLAYIRGKVEFYGHEFSVDKNVLVPRPESEIILEVLNTLPINEQSVVVDVGTGSGALAICAKLLRPESTVIGIDISQEALLVAEANAQKMHADVQFLEGNFIEPLIDLAITDKELTLLCNLPYVPDNHPVNEAARQEPALALFAGKDGLDAYRQLFDQVETLTLRPAAILTECLPSQQQELSALALRYGYAGQKHSDYIRSYTAEA